MTGPVSIKLKITKFMLMYAFAKKKRDGAERALQNKECMSKLFTHTVNKYKKNGHA